MAESQALPEKGTQGNLYLSMIVSIKRLGRNPTLPFQQKIMSVSSPMTMTQWLLPCKYLIGMLRKSS